MSKDLLEDVKNLAIELDFISLEELAIWAHEQSEIMEQKEADLEDDGLPYDVNVLNDKTLCR